MANSPADVHGHRSDLSDPGIASELATEAVRDIQNAASDTARRLAEGASDAADQIASTAQAAYAHPAEFADFSVRSLRRYARHKPFEAMTVAAGLAFAFGALWGLGRR